MGGTPNANTGGTAAVANTGGTGAVANTGGAAANTGGAVANTGGTPVPPGAPGDPGCGLAAAAFCDTFDAPSATRGRGGDLDPRRWSAARGEPQLPTGNGVVFGIPPATIPSCRPGVGPQVFPNDDTLVCGATAEVRSSHLLVATAAQNYGQNSYRIRQPFDFAGRTGRIVFDAEAFVLNPLLGWISLAVTEDPTPIPSFSIGSPGTMNNEGGAVPRNGFEVHFADQCAGSAKTPHVAVSLLDVLTDYKDQIFPQMAPRCVPTLEGRLNHFEIAVSQRRIEVYASAFSDDGVTFAPPTLIHSADVNLPFSRGYVHITTHNHATLKYSHNGDYGTTHVYDAWIARWDNVGFDGPVVSNWREHEIADSLVPGKNSWNVQGPVVSIGYTVADVTKGPNTTFRFRDVDVANVTSARIAVAAWYLLDQKVATFVLQYRLNGKAWHDRPFTPGELALLTNTHAQGALGQMLDVPTGELVAGDNTLELVTVNVPQGYPPAVSSIDLVLTTN